MLAKWYPLFELTIDHWLFTIAGVTKYAPSTKLSMNIVSAIIFLVGGLVILWKCAELLVAGAVALARRLGVSSLIIGLTVVAMGT